MNRFLTAVLLVLFGVLILVPASFGQQQTEGTRRILNRVTPQYPEMARSMNLRGNVKAEAVVEPNGVVKSVEVRGGHPVLVRAARTLSTSGNGRRRHARPGSPSKSGSILNNKNSAGRTQIQTHAQSASDFPRV